MTPTQMQIALAEWLKWTNVYVKLYDRDSLVKSFSWKTGDVYGCHPNSNIEIPAPPYDTSHDDLQPVIDGLDELQFNKFEEECSFISFRDKTPILKFSPLQKLEALCRTFGVYKKVNDEEAQ